MRLSVLMLVLFGLNLTAETTEAQKRLQDLNLKNANILEVFREIEAKSDFGFFFKDDQMNMQKRYSLKLENASIEEVLLQLFSDNEYSYEIVGENVVVMRKEVKREAPATKVVQQPQGKTVSGSVVDAAGDPIPGASVVIAGTTTGTISDMNGRFTLSGVPEEAVLNVSFIGMNSAKVSTAGQSTFRIVLEEEILGLDEVVVVGYGTQKKVNLTGAVGTASGEVLESRPITNVGQGLQGVIPNLNVTSANGAPGTGSSFNIRGGTSLNGGSALVLVDGVQTDLNLINPQDVESVSVLKDAAAASIYGARAAFGVVLITTKQGNRDSKTKVNYNNNFSWSKPTRLPEMPTSYQWAQAMNNMSINDGQGEFFTPNQMELIKAHLDDPVNNPGVFVDDSGIMHPAHTAENPGWGYVGNTNWFEELYKDNAFMQQHNASIQGGGEKSNFYGSLGYHGQNGLYRHGDEKYDRYNLTFNYTQDVSDWLELGFSTKYIRTKNDDPNLENAGMANPQYETYRTFPTVVMYLPDGNYAGMEGRRFNKNVAARMATAGRNIKEVDDLWFTGKFKMTPTEGWTVQGDYTVNKWFRTIQNHRKVGYQKMPNGESDLVFNTPNKYYMARNADMYSALNVWTQYNKELGAHGFSVMAGYNQESKQHTGMTVNTENLYLNDVPLLHMANDLKSAREPGSEWAVQGVFARLNYDFASKYLVEVNGRYDGSSKYREGNRWGFFPSASLGWRISEEGFFAPLRSTVDNLKFRFSLGELGNQVTNGNFDYVASVNGYMVDYIINSQQLVGISQPSLPNLNTSWERVMNYNVGLDWNLFENKLFGSFDYYIRETTGMVQNKAYPAVLGASGGKENIADMRTNGWELSLDWRDEVSDVLGKPLTYSVGIGLSDSYSEITKYDNPTGALGDWYEGRRLGEIWGYRTQGHIMTEAEAQEQGTRQSAISKNWRIGDIVYADLNNDGVVNYGDNTLSNSGDKEIIGNSTPRYRFNFRSSVKWRGFDLRIFFEGIAKRDVWLNSFMFWGYSGQWWSAITKYHYDNTWSLDNPDGYFIASNKGQNKQVQTKYLQNGAYIRLKELSLSYTIPKRLTDKIGIGNARVFVSGQNLWDATGLLPDIDPEIANVSYTGGDVGDGFKYPYSRTISGGLSVSF
ncbi:MULTISPECIES: SusC/RagA family TonB-linked outer membrane protein [unclassified Carboxylicivirga]|uniref:SusC/RagA family TonB-linked outer membrane protein n=1 Tax=Carboxylicivirga TaxID=1628153 RepID=UPI003D33D628